MDWDIIIIMDWDIIISCVYFSGLIVTILSMRSAIKELIVEDPDIKSLLREPYFWTYLTFMIIIWPASITAAAIIYKKEKHEDI